MGIQLYTVGYQRWRADKRIDELVSTLQTAGVNTLVDIRHSPCASNPKSGFYGPSDINLQAQGQGLPGHLMKAGIDYQWLVELGNPQKNDPSMAVLREHISEQDGPWPVHRGLQLLHKLVSEPARKVAILCACKRFDQCHRSLIANALSEQIPALSIVNL
jgi:hypothetical protein